MLEKYLVIYPSGVLAWEEIDRSPKYDDLYQGSPALDFRRLYQIIDCSCVEKVHTFLPGIVIVVDESGKIKLNPQAHNEIASRLYPGTPYGDDIVGPAFVFALRPTGPCGEMDWCPLLPADEARLSLFLGERLPNK